MSDKFQDFAQKKKLKHAGDPDVSEQEWGREKSRERE